MNKNITYKDIYLSVIKNKDLFNSKLKVCWGIVSAVQEATGGGKIRRPYDLRSSDQSNWMSRDSSIAETLDVRSLIDGTLLEKEAFAWYCAADLAKSSKYFSFDNMKSGAVAWSIGSENSIYSHDIHGYGSGMEGLLTLAHHLVPKNKEWRTKMAEKVMLEIDRELNINLIKDVLPSGFLEYVNKKIESAPSPKITAVNNKMDLMIWKKFVKSTPMTMRHFKSCNETDFIPGLWSDKWNTFMEAEGLMDKKYFQQAFFADGHKIGTPKNIHPTIARMGILKTKSGNKMYGNYKDIFCAIRLIENFDLSLTGEENTDFVNSVDVNDVLDRIEWGIFVDQGNENSFFTREKFVNNLNRVYT